MVSVEQLTALIEFMECHTEVALGRLNRSKEGRSQTKRLWEECAFILNSVSADCVTKTPEQDQWRVYYNEYKSKLMKKIKVEKAEIKATGGGPANKSLLTPLQERLYTILGRDFGEPLPGIQHNPLSQHQHDHIPEVVEDAMPLLRPPSEEQWQEMAETVVVIEIDDADVNRQKWCPREPPASTSMEFASEATGVTGSTASTSREFTRGPIPSTSRDFPPGAAPEPIRQATPAAPRRKRRRRRISREATEDEPALRQATDRLEALEQSSAEATRELAQATHRQAAALENIAEVLRHTCTEATRELAQATNRQAAALENIGEVLRQFVQAYEGRSPQ